MGIGGGRWREWGCPKDTIWHVSPFGTQSAILAEMGTLQILGIKLPQVPYCHIWQVQFLMLMWDIALGQSKITGIFFRQGHRVSIIIRYYKMYTICDEGPIGPKMVQSPTKNGNPLFTINGF